MSHGTDLYRVGGPKAGEWLEYTIDVATSGTYELEFRVSQSDAGATFHAEVDGVNVTGSLTAPDTNSFSTFTSVKQTVTLSAGQHVLRFAQDANAANGYAVGLDWMKLTQALYTSTAVDAPTPAGSSVVVTGGYDITAGGADIWGTSDFFEFLHRQQTGDFDLKVRVASLTAVDDYTMAGIRLGGCGWRDRAELAQCRTMVVQRRAVVVQRDAARVRCHDVVVQRRAAATALTSKAPKAPPRKIDPAFLARAPELRDRWMERVKNRPRARCRGGSMMCRARRSPAPLVRPFRAPLNPHGCFPRRSGRGVSPSRFGFRLTIDPSQVTSVRHVDEARLFHQCVHPPLRR